MLNPVLQQLRHKYNSIGQQYYLELIRDGHWEEFRYETDYKPIEFKGVAFDELGLDLSKLNFDYCKFSECSFRSIDKTSFRHSVITKSQFIKGSGLRADFRHSLLEDCRFEDYDLTGAKFRDEECSEDKIVRCTFLRVNLRLSLIELNLNECEFRVVDLRDSNLLGIVFRRCVLDRVDLRGSDLTLVSLPNSCLSSINVGMDIPVIPNLHQQVYEATKPEGALDLHAFHTCNTTHCWGGWILQLGGDSARALEQEYSSELACSLIFSANTKLDLPIPDWYQEDKEVVLKRIEEYAARERRMSERTQ